MCAGLRKFADSLIPATPIQPEGREVRLANGQVVTFTQRGRDKSAGFVRVAGKTVSGARAGDYFYANFDAPNYDATV